LGIPLEIKSFYDFFKILFKFATKFDVIVFDEFQNFYFVDKSIFSYIQQFWDETDDKVKIFVS
jgi:AAA+ ATPase superfamily predicted ATPase